MDLKNLSKMVRVICESLDACAKNNGVCEKCKFRDEINCSSKLSRAAKSLILEQVDFIEKILKDNKRLENDWNELFKKYFEILQKLELKEKMQND